jgi:hypothetical protein
MPQLPSRFAGSISEATLNPKHLVPRFVAVLERADPGHPLVTEWRQIEGACQVLADFLHLEPDDVADLIDIWNGDQMGYFLNEGLFDALNEVAPVGTYFSASEGDGASFGFWTDGTCPECGHSLDEGNPSCYACTGDAEERANA